MNNTKNKMISCPRLILIVVVVHVVIALFYSFSTSSDSNSSSASSSSSSPSPSQSVVPAPVASPRPATTATSHVVTATETSQIATQVPQRQRHNDTTMPPPLLVRVSHVCDAEKPRPLSLVVRNNDTGSMALQQCRNAASDVVGFVVNHAQLRSGHGLDARCLAAQSTQLKRFAKYLHEHAGLHADTPQRKRRQNFGKHINTAFRSGCVLLAIESANREFSKSMPHQERQQQQEQSKVSAASSKRGRRVMIVAALSLTTREQIMQLRVILLGFLLHCEAGRDELHVLVDISDAASAAPSERALFEFLRHVVGATGRYARWKKSRPQQRAELPDVVLVPTVEWVDSHVTRAYPPANLRVILLEHYFAVVLPQRHFERFILCDSRDVVIQSNPFDALDDAVSVYSSSSSLTDFVFATSEGTSLSNKNDIRANINRQWTTHFLGPEAVDRLLTSADSSGRDDEQHFKPRRLPDGRELPVINSGIFGGTFRALRDFLMLFKKLMLCGAVQRGEDQGVFAFMVYHALDAARFRHDFVLLDELTGPFRHWVVRGAFSAFAMSVTHTCLGRKYAIVHQADRIPGLWGRLTEEALSLVKV